MKPFYLFFTLFMIFLPKFNFAQIVINEGSNRNYSTIADEDGEFNDWIELYNPTADTVSLLNYSLTDNSANPQQWTFPAISMLPGEYKTVFCSGKNRKPISGFTFVLNQTNYTPVVGWNTHTFTTPFYWDGVSNVLVNTCSYENSGYTANSVVNQSATSFNSSVFTVQDNSDIACSLPTGNAVSQRPNMRFNGFQVGTGTIQNSGTDYPAPYGNWYWGARHQFLVLASELTAAGLTQGNINSFAFDVVSTSPTMVYDYFDVSIKLVAKTSLNQDFESVNPSVFQHTNFSISQAGETIYLYSPNQTLVSQLYVNIQNLDNSRGLSPDASTNVALFETGTPDSTNNTSTVYGAYLLPPVFSAPSGVYGSTLNVSMSHPNGFGAQIYYTLDGSEPTTASNVYTGTPIPIFYSSVLRARVLATGFLASETKVASYLLGIDHVTPILSLVTDNQNLYGPTGIFDNWQYDWQRAANADYFDVNNNLVFSQKTGMQIDGGLGGSRSHPQHSFRLELNNSTLGDGSVNALLIPNKPNRTKYSNLYLRNGSNQWLQFPYKDGFQEEAMSGTTNNYYSAWQPVSVYINGGYFGLYELREKLDDEFFKLTDNAHKDSLDILSLSAWNNSTLRSVYGSPVDTFFTRYNAFNTLNTNAPNYWDVADSYFDLKYYTDYIIAESWMGNVDWPQNNIKIYRSNKTDFRYRFCTIDMELALEPYAWTDCFYDHIQYMLSQSTNNPFINVWLKSVQNNVYHDYFINRFADVMNTEYLTTRLLPLEDTFFNATVVEMQNEYTRWGNPNAIPQQMNDLYNAHLTFQSQLEQRNDIVRADIEGNFNLPNQVDLVLDVHPSGAGKIHISTIEPTTYPWNGIYFNGVPIKIEAIANFGYNFSNWGNNGIISDILNAVYLDTLDVSTIQFDAYFTQSGLGIAENANLTANFNVYPNPASNEMTFVNASTTNFGDLKLTVVDLTGRYVATYTLASGTISTVLPVSNLSDGAYAIQVENQFGVIDQIRFIKLND